MQQVKFVHVPHYDELAPENVISTLGINNEKLSKNWADLLEYCPELRYRKRPKDRDFFFNVLNTIKPKSVE